MPPFRVPSGRTTSCSDTAQQSFVHSQRATLRTVQRFSSEACTDLACARETVICCQRPVSRQTTKRRQIAEWLPYSRGMQFQGRPVRMRQRIPLMQARVVHALPSRPQKARGINSCNRRHSVSSKSCSCIRSYFRCEPQSHAPGRTELPRRLFIFFRYHRRRMP